MSDPFSLARFSTRVQPRVLTEISGHPAQEALGATDAIKLHSCITLFTRVAPEAAVFRQVIDQYFEGIRDGATEALLG
jgi:uncharacterized protein (DUF1810 family)